MNLPKTPGRTTPAFGFSYVERALRDCLQRREFRQVDKDSIVDFFEQWEPQPSCVFCGVGEVKRWDHLVPVMDYGSTVVGNMVLSCAPCDDSKGRVPYAEWIRGPAPKSPTTLRRLDVEERIGRIERYVDDSGYTAVKNEHGMDESERKRLDAVRSELARVRAEVESLIRDFRKRTGLK